MSCCSMLDSPAFLFHHCLKIMSSPASWSRCFSRLILMRKLSNCIWKQFEKLLFEIFMLNILFPFWFGRGEGCVQAPTVKLFLKIWSQFISLFSKVRYSCIYYQVVLHKYYLHLHIRLLSHVFSANVTFRDSLIKLAWFKNLHEQFLSDFHQMVAHCPILVKNLLHVSTYNKLNVNFQAICICQ